MLTDILDIMIFFSYPNSITGVVTSICYIETFLTCWLKHFIQKKWIGCGIKLDIILFRSSTFHTHPHLLVQSYTINLKPLDLLLGWWWTCLDDGELVWLMVNLLGWWWTFLDDGELVRMIGELVWMMVNLFGRWWTC